MADEDGAPDAASDDGGKGRSFLIACALIYGGCWLITGDSPGIYFGFLLFPFVLLAYMIIHSYAVHRGEGVDTFETSNEMDGAVHVAQSLAEKWPAFSAYVLAPLVALATLVLIFKVPRAFFFFQSEGSAAGLFVPIFMWALVAAGFVIAGVLFFAGTKHLDK